MLTQPQCTRHRAEAPSGIEPMSDSVPRCRAKGPAVPFRHCDSTGGLPVFLERS